MNFKRLVAVAIISLFLIPYFPHCSHFVQAGDWVLQISDPKDSGKDVDIKSVFARDDSEYLYFKVESYNNWNLDDNRSGFGMYIGTDGSKNPDDRHTWCIAIMENNGTYIGMVFDFIDTTMEPITCEFKNNSQTGTFKVRKSILKLTSNKFSMATVILDLTRKGEALDLAPDDFNFVLYKPGSGNSPAKLGVSPKSINLGILKYDETVSGSFDISNEGGGTFSATLKTSTNISLSSQEITLDAYESDTVKVFADATKLSPKSYTESIDIQSKAGNETVTVSFEVLPKPVLNVDTELLDFGTVIKGEKRAEKIRISNKVKGAIKGTITSTNRAIILSKSTFDSETEDITVSLSTKNLDPGPLTAKIKINSNGGFSTVEVTAEIVNALILSKGEFDFGEINLDEPKTDPLPFTIQNMTDQKISLKISTSEDWIAIGSDISIGPKETKELNVAFKLSKMETINKLYSGSVTFETKYDKQIIPVKAYLKQDPPKTLWVTDPPDQKSVEEKVVTGKTFEKLFTIKNDGSGVMTVSVKLEDPKTDFRLFNARFTLKKGETQEIKVKLDTRGLKLEKYQNTLQIESSGGNLSIPISVEVVPKPIVIIKLYIGLSNAYIDQEQVALEAPPYIKKGTTMVPLRFITTAFKAKIEWISIGKGRIVLTVPTKTIQLDIGESFAFINNEKLPLQAPPEIKSGRTFVPVRFIAEGLGAQIDWKASTQQITIFYTIEE